MTEASAIWVELDVQRLLYVDRGRETILLDRYGSGAGTVLVKLSDEAMRKLLIEFSMGAKPGLVKSDQMRPQDRTATPSSAPSVVVAGVVNLPPPPQLTKETQR